MLAAAIPRALNPKKRLRPDLDHGIADWTGMLAITTAEGMLGTMKRIVVTTAALASALTAAAILALAIGAFLKPTSSLYAVVASMVWAPFGPFLLLSALLAFVVGLAVRMSGLRRLGTVVLVLATPSILGSGVILARIGLAASLAGAMIDLPATLMPGRMDSPAPDVVETVRTIDGQALNAAIYLPAASPDPAPIITYIHGGGFKIGTNTESAADLRWFADRGWLVVSVAYRLFKPGRPTWDKAPDDVACALIWTARNAARFGGDATRIALLGDSAGGNLAINLGFAAAAGRATSTCEGNMPVPGAIAVLYPAVDPLSIYHDGFPIPGFEPQMLIEGYIGGTPDQYPGRIAAVSSATYLTSAAPPTLIILPQSDALVVAEGTRSFVREAAAADAQLELVQIPFANHVFNQIAANTLGNQIGRTIRLRFLEQNLK